MGVNEVQGVSHALKKNVHLYLKTFTNFNEYLFLTVITVHIHNEMRHYVDEDTIVEGFIDPAKLIANKQQWGLLHIT